MTRRVAVRAAAAAPYILTSRSAATQSPAGGRPWNILWLSSEDTSPDFGCYGDSYAHTPNLDRLASQGARYTHAFSVYGVCAPSRSSIITGMYPTAIGTCHMRSDGVPPSEVKCFTEYLRAAGYYCTNNVKTDYNFPPPLTAWDESSNRAHYKNREPGQPFFAVFNDTISHESQIRAAPEDFARQTAALQPSERHDPNKAKLPSYYPDTPVVRRDWANYYDLVTAMDYHVGQRLKELEDAGLADSTIVMYWGDHGRGLPRGKRWVYDSGIHVPLIIRWPGQIRPGTVESRMVSLMDLGPTLLSIAGIAPPSYMHGRAFLGQHQAAPRKYIFAARDRMDETYDIIRAVRDSRYKYIRNYQACKPYAQYIDYMDQMPSMREWRRLHKEGKLTGPQRNFFAPEKPPEELYDTQTDPDEVVNLAGKPDLKPKLAELRAAHERWKKDQPDLGLIPEDELKERMRPGGKKAVTAAPKIEIRAGTCTLSCPTPGASIAYTLETGDRPRWKLYAKSFSLATGARLRVRACRIGYEDSPEVTHGS